jgi:hypothetical protein
MAELGETTDPKALVPGDPAALQTTARSLDTFGTSLNRVGGGLRAIDDGGWTGQAADAFRNAFDGEPARWTTCGECFVSARDALDNYSRTLSWAQGEAAAAIDLWERGEQATNQAKAAHQQQEQQAAQAAAAAGEPTPAATPFSDPGESLRQQARDQLDRARGQVTSEGNNAAGILARAQESAPEEPNWLEETIDDIGDAFGNAVRDVGEAVADGIRAVGDGIDTVLDGVGDVVEGALDTAGDVVDGALDTAGDVAGGVLRGVGDLTGINAISDAGDSVDGALDDAGDSVDGALDDAGDAVDGAADDAGDEVSDAADDAGDEVEDTADDAGDTVDPDDETGEEDSDGDGEDGDADDQDEDDADDEPETDRNGHWENSTGETPNPNDVSASDARAHILYGDADGEGGGHRHDSGVPNKTTFPPDWDDDQIIDQVEDVAKNPDNPPVYDEEREAWTVTGTRDGVDIEVIVQPDGTIRTGYPTGGEGVHRNNDDGDPEPLD